MEILIITENYEIHATVNYIDNQGFPVVATTDLGTIFFIDESNHWIGHDEYELQVYGEAS
jgi:hypothetical protein